MVLISCLYLELSRYCQDDIIFIFRISVIGIIFLVVLTTFLRSNIKIFFVYTVTFKILAKCRGKIDSLFLSICPAYLLYSILSNRYLLYVS